MFLQLFLLLIEIKSHNVKLYLGHSEDYSLGDSIPGSSETLFRGGRGS